MKLDSRLEMYILIEKIISQGGRIASLLMYGIMELNISSGLLVTQLARLYQKVILYQLKVPQI